MTGSSDLLKDAINLLPRDTRRNFLRYGLTLGGLSLLTGCNAVDEDEAKRVLSHEYQRLRSLGRVETPGALTRIKV
jgi:hypothetical protein